MQSKLIVACGIILVENRILIAQRSERMRLPLKWEFPGGKIEPGESAEDCLHREILEELNIKIRIRKKLAYTIYKYDDYEVCLIPFLAEYISGVLHLKEHKQYLFVHKSRLREFDFAPADIPIIDSFIELY